MAPRRSDGGARSSDFGCAAADRHQGGGATARRRDQGTRAAARRRRQGGRAAARRRGQGGRAAAARHRQDGGAGASGQVGGEAGDPVAGGRRRSRRGRGGARRGEERRTPSAWPSTASTRRRAAAPTGSSRAPAAGRAISATPRRRWPRSARAIAPRWCAPVASWTSICAEEGSVEHQSVLRGVAGRGRRPRGTSGGGGQGVRRAEGMTVTVVPLRPPADGKVLVRDRRLGDGVRRQGHPPHRGTSDAGRANYETTYHGRAWFTIAVPTASTPIPITCPAGGTCPRSITTSKPDRGASDGRPSAAYGKQQADGTLKALAAFDRQAETARQRKSGMRGAGDSVREACGTGRR